MTINDFKLTNLIHRLPQKKYLSYVLQIVIIGYLLYQISQIGIKNANKKANIMEKLYLPEKNG